MQINLNAAPAGADMQADTQPATTEMDDFIYLISHDVRASVRALLELPQWIEEDLDSAGISTAGSIGTSIELMNRHAGRLDRMLVDLLTYSRVGRMQSIQSLPLSDVLDDVLDQISVPAGFHVTRDLRCETVLMGDRDLPLLLSALVSNAVKHHNKPTGHIHITAYQQENCTYISVADDGPGIEETYSERVFSPMTTLRPRDDVEGSGMGLANVRKIAEYHGGQASLQRSPFEGGACVQVCVKAPPVQ